MSTGPLLDYGAAMRRAEELVDALEGVCDRVEIAGSLRRKLQAVRDIEIVCVPRSSPDLLGGRMYEPDAVRRVLARFGNLGKAGDRYTSVVADGVKVHVFLVHPPAEWGTILAIRTGPAELGRWAVTRMKRRGFRCVNGHVERTKTGERYPTPTEAEFFAAAGLAHLPPWKREGRGARLPV